MTTVADLIRELGKYPADAVVLADFTGDPSVGIPGGSFDIGDTVQFLQGEFGELTGQVVILSLED